MFQTFNLVPTLSAAENVEAALEQVGLPDRVGNLPGEPTGNDIITLLERLWRDHGITLVLITHDTFAARRAQRTGVMNKGRLTVSQATAPPPGRPR